MDEAKELAALFDAFYSKFVLRDLFGKIVPGFIALAGAAVVVGKTPTEMVKFAEQVPVGAWFIAYGLAWLAGFAVQSLGELIGLARYYDTSLIANHEAFYEYRMLLTRPRRADEALPGVDTEAAARTVERMVVIREACGNGSTALLLLFVMEIVSALISGHKAGYWCAFRGALPALVPTIVCAILLYRMHLEHVDREHRYYATALNAAGLTPRPGLLLKTPPVIQPRHGEPHAR